VSLEPTTLQITENVVVDRRFIALMIEAVHTSETSVHYETTRRSIPGGCNLQTPSSMALLPVFGPWPP
jgi:hypothetical protein